MVEKRDKMGKWKWVSIIGLLLIFVMITINLIWGKGDMNSKYTTFGISLIGIGVTLLGVYLDLFRKKND